MLLHFLGLNSDSIQTILDCGQKIISCHQPLITLIKMRWLLLSLERRLDLGYLILDKTPKPMFVYMLMFLTGVVQSILNNPVPQRFYQVIVFGFNCHYLAQPPTMQDYTNSNIRLPPIQQMISPRMI